MKETGADALKLEGGEEVIETITKIIGAGMPVMGHLGLMPQSINKYGTYGVRAKGDAEAEKLIRDAHLLEEAGCFALVLEKIPADLAARVASELTIPVIGIGAGGAVDGQVLVVADMLGMTKGFHALGGSHNIGGMDLDFKFLGTDFSKLKDYRYEGWFIGAGERYKSKISRYRCRCGKYCDG